MPTYDAAAVAARPGERGLDVGCGAGHLACELAREVATGGRIDAVDRSRDSVDASNARVAREKLAGIVEVRAGDAVSLDFPDESFDFAVGTQVYWYMPDVARAYRKLRVCCAKAVAC